MLASALPLTISQTIAKAPASAKGGPDGLIAGSDTFARELGLAQARGAAAPRPVVPQAVTQAPPPAAAPGAAGQPPRQAAPERSSAGGHDNGPQKPAAKEAEETAPARHAGTPPATSNGTKPGGTTSAARSVAAPKVPEADTAHPARGTDEAPPAAGAADATTAGDLASMIASLLGLDSAAQASGLPAQGPGGQPAGGTAAGPNGQNGVDDQAAVALASSGVGVALPAGAAAAAGHRGSAKPPGKDAAEPAAGGAAAPALPSAASLAAAAQTAAQATSPADARPAAFTADSMTPPAAAAPLTTAMASSMPQPAVGATARQDGTAAPFDAQLAAALGSPEFAPALGHQVSLLVRGGVQEARLHLNPAEMGPITVQIALDGQTAQINLAAEQPLTRQMLEQAMPALASALRESGLTLTGGGVFEQPRDPRQGEPEARPASRSAATVGSDGTPAVPVASVRTLRGAVDLIA